MYRISYQNFFYPLLARLPPDEDPAVETGRVRRPVQVGEEVLARWSDEGWYYRGNTRCIYITLLSLSVLFASLFVRIFVRILSLALMLGAV